MVYMQSVAYLLIVLFLFPAGAFGLEKRIDSSSSDTFLTDSLGIAEGETRLPGVGLAEGLTQVTGVAISPLLGVSIVGSWNYFRTTKEDRHLLPWVCHPVFWGIGFGVLAIVFLKDALGAALPSFVKKPLDLVELFEDKFSAIIAGTAFVPFLVEQYARNSPPISAGESFAGIAAAIPILAEINPIWILTPIALAGFAVVWIVSHTINVLIVLSPFGLLDALLKIGRLFIFSFLGLLYLISPFLAAILAVIIIAVCAYFAPSAFRLGFYGSVISGDYLQSMFWKSNTDLEKIRCFLAKRGNKRLKVRTLGRVGTGIDGHAIFRSRRMFLGPWRSVRLPSNGTLYLTNGFLFPTLQTVCSETGNTETLLHLLPRYRHDAEAVAKIVGVEFRETPVLRGFTATRKWLSNFLRAGRERAIESFSPVGELNQ